MENQVLKAIRERRSVFRFKPSKLEKESLENILDAGRWAPSWTNTQPWSFIVVDDPELKRMIGEAGYRITMFSTANWMADAAAIIVVSVDPHLDPYHYIEDGAIATHNMALAAHSLGYETYYLGIYDVKASGKSVEKEVKKLLKIPDKMRVIALLPVGTPDMKPESSRKPLHTMIYYNKYG